MPCVPRMPIPIICEDECSKSSIKCTFSVSNRLFSILGYNEHLLLIDDPDPARPRINKKKNIFDQENIFKGNDVFETDNIFKQ